MTRCASLIRVTDEQWCRLGPLLLRGKLSKRGGGPPADNRAVFKGMLWVS